MSTYFDLLFFIFWCFGYFAPNISTTKFTAESKDFVIPQFRSATETPDPKKQLEEIAKKKMDDLNANDLEEASKIIAGSARSMGIEVKE